MRLGGLIEVVGEEEGIPEEADSVGPLAEETKSLLAAFGISMGLSNSLFMGGEKIGDFAGVGLVGHSHTRVVKVGERCENKREIIF